MIYRLLNRAGESKKRICGTCGKEKVITWWGYDNLDCQCNHSNEKGEKEEVTFYIRRRNCKEHYLRHWVEEENNKGVYTFRKMEEELVIEEGKIPVVRSPKVVDTLVIDLVIKNLYYQSPKGRVCQHSQSRLTRFTGGCHIKNNKLLSIWYDYLMGVGKGSSLKYNILGALESMYKLGWNHNNINHLMKEYLSSYKGEETSIYKILGIRKGEEKYIFKYDTKNHWSAENYISNFLVIDRKKRDWIIRFHEVCPEIALDGYGGYSRAYDLCKLCDSGYAPEKLAQYITQDVLWQGITSPTEVLSILVDTMEMVQRMEGAKLNRYPKSLKLYHDITSMNYNKIKEETLNKQFNERVTSEEYKKREWKNKKYSILSPVVSSDLIKEGQSMSHCVATYVDRVAEGSSDIYFLRKNENIDKSLVTIEVRDNTITQCRAKANTVPCEEELKAVAEWMKKKKLKNIVSYLKNIEKPLTK